MKPVLRHGIDLRRFGMCLVVALGAAWSATPAPAQSDRDRTSLSAREWSSRVWEEARADQGAPDRVFDEWGRVPSTHTDAGVRNLRSGLDHFLSNLDASIEERAELYSDSMSELATALDEDRLADALAHALAAHEVALRPREVASVRDTTSLPTAQEALAAEIVVRAVRRAEAAAELAESRGDLFEAHELYYRLNALMSEDQRFERDVERVARRLALIRFYDDRQFYSLSREYQLRQGEADDDERPFQADPEPWRERLAGVSQSLARQTLAKAVKHHLWQPGWGELLDGGFEALETLVTTTQLESEFPGLARRAEREAFLDYLMSSRARLRDLGSDAESWKIFLELRDLVEKAQDTVGLPEAVVVHEFTEGAVARLDSFSSVIWPYDLDMFARQLDGSFTGVGIQITLDEARRLRIVTPLEDTPAHHAGIRADDYIKAIDGHSTVGISLDQAVSRITGPKGTQVTLTIEREADEDPIDYTLRREEIEIFTVKGWRHTGPNEWDWLIDPERGVGYIRLTGFLDRTPNEFDRAIHLMKEQADATGLRGLILDLRFNPGGQLRASVEIANRFVDDGAIVSTRGPRTLPQERKASRARAAALDGVEVVVLVNEGSASASEIVAGALKDHDRALIVGTRTYGKGSVQKIEVLSGGDALFKLTGEYYVLPKGGVIHREDDSTEWGVDPHLLVRMPPGRIADAIRMRQDADALADGLNGAEEELVRRDPNRLLDEGIDLQLQTGLIMLQSRLLDSVAEHALLETR
ncbi:MAG: S41 family peptidase [Phycisphaerales bacterium]